MTIRWTAAALALAIAACSEAPRADNVADGTTNDTVVAAGETNAAAPMGGGNATAPLRTASGAAVGTATASEEGVGVRIALDVSGMPPGTHGVHVHTVGKCDGPKFETAGSHWNPTARQHGSDNPQGPHAGDLPNLTVGADGRGTLAMSLPAGTMAELLDADGAAFVVHAKADDLKTDPSGDSGDRIACGVFATG